MASPENPTLIEKFVQLIPLRYPLAVLAWTAILGPVSFAVANYLETGANPLYLPSPVNAIFGILLNLYLFYVVHYLRLRVVTVEPQITPIMSGGEEEYHAVFGRLNNYMPIILLTLLLEALTGLATRFSDFIGFTPLHVYNQITRVFVLLGFATMIWEYCVSSWGLHRLGRSDLRLKPFLEDRFMGARSIGNVALSLTEAFLAALLLFFLDSASFLPLSIELAAFFLILLGFGMAMFLLPLNSVHVKMQAEKAARQQELSQQLLRFKQVNWPGSSDGPASIERVERAVTELVRLKDLEMTEKKLAGVPTWPFDIQVLARLITIVLSITAVLLSRVIVDLLKIP